MTKAELHQKISYMKSVVRLVGYGLIPLNLLMAALILVISELLGIAEEIWGS